MKLKPDDKEAITKWLGERCGQMRRFCCGHSRWQLLEESSSKLDSTPIQAGFTRTPFSLEAILRLYGLY
jgi:hypothetical protein